MQHTTFIWKSYLQFVWKKNASDDDVMQEVLRRDTRDLAILEDAASSKNMES